MKKTVVIADIPRCGLGNKMLVWAKAMIFARAHDLPLYTFGWEQFNLGPLLRGERSNRFYTGYFKKERNLLSAATHVPILSKSERKGSAQRA